MQNSNQPSRERALVLLGLVLLVALVGWGLAREFGWIGGSQDAPQSGRQELLPNEVPARFPGDAPVPGDATIEMNYQLVAEDGREQSTRSYRDERALADVAASYEAYFESGGWKVLTEATYENYRAFVAQRDTVRLQVALNAAGASATAVTLTSMPATPQASQ